MRRLILLRHGKTVASVPAGDHARPLTSRGGAEARSAADRLAAMARPDLALVSDARRTRESFDRLIESFGQGIAHRFESRLYGASADVILGLVAETPEEVQTLLVIGHNPGIGEAARHLARDAPAERRRDLDEHFPTSAFAVLTATAPVWTRIDEGCELETFSMPHRD